MRLHIFLSNATNGTNWPDSYNSFHSSTSLMYRKDLLCIELFVSFVQFVVVKKEWESSVTYKVHDGLCDTFGVHTVVMEDLSISAVDDILVGDADDADRHGVLAQRLTDDGTQTAELRVLLDGNDATRLLGGLADGLLVEGLDP